jgi:signal peptidase I
MTQYAPQQPLPAYGAYQQPQQQYAWPAQPPYANAWQPQPQYNPQPQYYPQAPQQQGYLPTPQLQYRYGDDPLPPPAFAAAMAPAPAENRKEKHKNTGLNIAIACVLLLIAAVAVPKLMGVQMRAVLTGSMEPELPVGSLVVAVPTPYEKVKVGDDVIYVFNSALKVVTHRVIAKDPATRMITTQGIASALPDAPILYGNVLGVVKLHVPHIGRPLMWLDSTRNKIIAVVIFMTLSLILLLLRKLAALGKREGDIEKLPQ